MMVGIHQPNYLPWLGYFDKMARVDVFVFLDHVQMSRGHGRKRSYTQRVQILGQAGPVWLTVPVRKENDGDQAITETLPDAATDWRRAHSKALQVCYGRHPGFADVFPQLSGVLMSATGSLADINIRIITAIAAEFGLKCRFIRSSDLSLSRGRKSELLAEIVRSVGGTRYLYGQGGAEYQDEDVFRRAGIEPVAQGFVHPTYPQVGNAGFCSGLSIVDPIFNIGYSGTRELLGGR